MKKFKAIFLILIILIITSCTKKEEQKIIESANSPLIFEVTKDGYDNKIYLVGSIHVADETVYPLPENIMNAFNQSDYLAVEFDLINYTSDVQSQYIDMQKFLYPNGETIHDYVDENTYEKLKEILSEVNLYTTLYDAYTPMIWVSLIEQAASIKSGLDSQKGIDMYFLNEAKNNSMEIIELESANLQYNILVNLDEELQLFLLNESIDNFEESITETKTLYEKYKIGDRLDLEEYIFSEETEDELLIEYNEVFIDDRNKQMFKKLTAEFEEGKNIFCTVGLAHVIGENGLVNMFINKGFVVKEG